MFSREKNAVNNLWLIVTSERGPHDCKGLLGNVKFQAVSTEANVAYQLFYNVAGITRVYLI